MSAYASDFDVSQVVGSALAGVSHGASSSTQSQQVRMEDLEFLEASDAANGLHNLDGGHTQADLDEFVQAQRELEHLPRHLRPDHQSQSQQPTQSQLGGNSQLSDATSMYGMPHVGAASRSEVGTESQLTDLAALGGSMAGDESQLELLGDDGEAGEAGEASESTTYDFSTLPAHHCRYCGIHTPSSVVKCNVCSKWFCNAKGVTGASHIINHLVRARHRDVQLHSDSALGDSILECYACGNRNVFLLGFIPAKADSVVMLLCRAPCLHASLKDAQWDPTQWLPLIEDRKFLTWLVRPPADRELMRARQLTAQQLQKLEELWKVDPSAELGDLDSASAASLLEAEAEPVCVRYDDAFHYQNIMGPLVQLEAEYDRRMKESQSQPNIVVRWDTGLNKKRLACFKFTRRDDSELRVLTGDELLLKYDGDAAGNAPWQSTGTVVKISATDEMTLEIRNVQGAPIDQTTGFLVEFVWKVRASFKRQASSVCILLCYRILTFVRSLFSRSRVQSTSFDRAQKALKTFAIDEYSVTGYVYHLLLGHEPETPQAIKINMPHSIFAPGLPELNYSQVSAVKAVLTQPLSLIQGPPGTGQCASTSTMLWRHLSCSVHVSNSVDPSLVFFFCRQDCDERNDRVSSRSADAQPGVGVRAVERRRGSAHREDSHDGSQGRAPLGQEPRGSGHFGRLVSAQNLQPERWLRHAP